MKNWIQTVKKEHWIVMTLTLGFVGFATVAHAAGGAVAAWQPMGALSDSVQGVPAFACGTLLMVSGAATLGMGDLGIGAKRIALGVGAAGVMTNAAATLNALGVAGALS